MYEFLIRHWEKLLIPGSVFLAIMLAALIARRVIFKALDRWARKSATELDNILVDALHAPFLLWALILSASLATQISALPERVTRPLSKGFLILWVISFTLVASKLAGSLVRHYGSKAKTNLPVTTLTQNLARLATATRRARPSLSRSASLVRPTCWDWETGKP